MSELDALAQQAEANADAAAAALDAADSDFAARVRTWFVEAWTSKFWRNFRKYAPEDMGFYTAAEGGQWSFEGSTEDLEKVKASGRAVVSVNHIQPVVDVLSGYERQNRYDLKTMPQGDEDSEQAQLMTLLLKHEQEQTDSAAICSETFENTVITGMSAVDVSIDWTRDPTNPDIELEQLFPGEDVIWDPFWIRKDLRDARYVLRFHTAWVEDIVAEYPEHEKDIRESVGLLGATEVEREGGKLSQFSNQDAYGGARNHPSEDDEIRGMFYDEAGGGRVMVIEAWYVDYEDVFVVVDKKSGTVTAVESGQAAAEMASADPDNLTKIRRRKRVIKAGVVLPGLYRTLEEDDQPYENDSENYPIVPCMGKRKGDQCYGLVRNLKDPQRIENKRESQMIDLIAKLANLRIMYEENALVTPATLKDHWSPEPIAIRAGHQPPSFLTPPLGEVVNVLRMSGDRNKMFIRESSGINTELLGLETDQSSGIAIARRQAQGQVISTGWFDNYRQFRKTLGQRLARRIQQVYTMERTMRLTGPDGSEVLLTMNPADARDLPPEEFSKYREQRKAAQTNPDLRPAILKDVSALKYDVVISEVPTTPTMRATSLLAILEILKVMPGLAPALMDVVVELAEIPDRTRILQRVKALMQGAQAPPGGGGTLHPPGTPIPPPGMAPPTTVGASGTPIGDVQRKPVL